MAIEQVPDIPMFRKNPAAFVHELPAGALANVDGDGGRLGPVGPRPHRRRTGR